MNNKIITIVSGSFLIVLGLIFALTSSYDNQQIAVLLTIAFFADILALVSAIVRWIKHGEITHFTTSDEDF